MDGEEVPQEQERPEAAVAAEGKDGPGAAEDDVKEGGALPPGLEGADSMCETEDDGPLSYSGTNFSCASAFEEMNPSRRSTMEDAHVILPVLAGDADTSYFGVYDGHGGRHIVEYVEEHLHEDVAQQLRETEDKEQALREAYTLCDMNSRSVESTTGGATAVTALVCREGDARVLYTAGVGDSRAVLVRNGRAQRLTVDHRPADPDERRRVEAAGGFFLRDRVLGILAVTRSFGDHGMKDFVSAEPFTSKVELQEGDQCLILACDGVWDVMEDQEAADLVMPLAASAEDQATAARVLVDAAIRGDTADNVTAIVIYL